MKKYAVLILMIQMSANIFAAEKMPEFFKRTNTEIKNPMDLRDPFKRRSYKIKSKTTQKLGDLRTNFSNLPTLENTPLDKIKILGVILGENRRAIARLVRDDELKEMENQENRQQDFRDLGRGGEREEEIKLPVTYVITEGMKIGLNSAEVKAILPGGIVLVEKIRNVYDQEEYIETIIPVTVE